MRQVLLFLTSPWSLYHTWIFTQGHADYKRKFCYRLWHLSPNCNVIPERWNSRYWSLWISQKTKEKMVLYGYCYQNFTEFSQLIFTVRTWGGFLWDVVFAESCNSELQPHLSNTNHLFIPHFLACYSHMEAIRTHILQWSALIPLLGSMLCPYSQKMSSSSSIWKHWYLRRVCWLQN